MPGTTKENTYISRARKAGYKGTNLAGAKKFLENSKSVPKKHKFDKMPKAPKKNGPKRPGMPKRDGNLYMKEAEGMMKKAMSSFMKASKFYKKHSKKK